MLLRSTTTWYQQKDEKKESKDDNIISLPTHLSKLYKDKTSILETVQRRGGKTTQTCNNTKVREQNKSYIEVLAKLEYWRINKQKDKIIRYSNY